MTAVEGPVGAIRLLSWNLNGRRGEAAAQVAALCRYKPDIVALQEVTTSSLPIVRKELASAGLAHVADSFSLAPRDWQPMGPRRYGQLTASGHPLAPELPGRFPIPWPERVLSVQVDVHGLRIDVHNTHVPPGVTNKWTKIDVLNGIFTALAVSSAGPRILCGDFNTPQVELHTGEVITWGQRQAHDGSWRVCRTRCGRPGVDWDSGERQVLTGLAEFDLVDVYRSLHGYGIAEKSWILRRGDRTVERRFDHVFASAQLTAVTCRYLHELRECGLSDHSPVEVEFDLSARG